jgi:glycosyltransferase involved in cell wall biosynthesis
MQKKLIRITTVPMALKYLLPGQMKFMQANGFEVIMISADGPERNDVIAAEGCEHIIVPMTRKITPLQDFKCLLQLIKLFKKLKPDIVHTHTPKAGLLGMLAAKFSGVKIRIHTVAGLPLMVEKGFKFWLLKNIEKITYAAANQVWPNSNSLLNYITEHKLTNPKKLSIIAKGSTNGININRFNKQVLKNDIVEEVKLSINYSNKFTYLLCVGRMVADKGIVELVNAFLSVQKIHANLKLIVVGSFEVDLDPLPVSTIQQIKNNSSIIHIEWTQHVEYFMHISHYFVFASHREGFPNVLLQAGAMQLPIICSGIIGNIDIVQHEETGLIFEATNQLQLEQQIVYAISHLIQMQTMVTNLQQIIKNNFTTEYIWQTILKQYTSLLLTKN